jgi:hypothetical protein
MAEDGPQEEKRVTLAQIAADWGTSVAYVSRMKTTKGCPVSSIEAARAWREEQAQGGVGFRSKKKSPAAGEADGDGGLSEDETEDKEDMPRQGLPRRKSLKQMEASLRASIEIEEEAKHLVDRAISLKAYSRLPLLIQAYNKAKEGRLQSEKLVMEIRQKARLLVPFDEARELFNKGWSALLSRLRSVPTVTAPKVCPEDDVTAEKIIRAELEKAIADGQKTYQQVMA